MSAFICNSDHFKMLAAFAVDHHGGYGCRSMNVDPRYFTYDGGEAQDGKEPEQVASYYADLLYCENFRSVKARYPNDTRDDLPGPLVKPPHIVLTAAELRSLQSERPTPALIFKMCDCLEYQSCETEDYCTTPAYKLLNRIRSAAWHQLPGYEDAPGWTYERPAKPTPAESVTYRPDWTRDRLKGAQGD